MPHPFWEDLSAFFDPDDFATSAIITRDEAEVAEVLGIFDDPTQVAELGEYEHELPFPRFVCQEVHATNIRTGDVAMIEGRKFDIMQDPELDGTGLATLVLATPNVIHNAGI